METELRVAAIAVKREFRCTVSDIAKPELFQKLESAPRPAQALVDLAELGLAVSRLGITAFRVGDEVRVVMCRDGMVIPLDGGLSAALIGPRPPEASNESGGSPASISLGGYAKGVSDVPRESSPGNVEPGGRAVQGKSESRNSSAPISAGRTGLGEDGRSPGNVGADAPSKISAAPVGAAADTQTEELRDLWADSLLGGS